MTKKLVICSGGNTTELILHDHIEGIPVLVGTTKVKAEIPGHAGIHDVTLQLQNAEWFSVVDD